MKQITAFMYLAAAITVMAFLYLTTFYNPTDIQVKVNQVDKIEKRLEIKKVSIQRYTIWYIQIKELSVSVSVDYWLTRNLPEK